MRDTMFFNKLRVLLCGWRWKSHRRASWMKARLRRLRRHARHLVGSSCRSSTQSSPSTYASRFILEPLEHRILLAADLTGVVQSATLIDPAVPGNTASAVVQVQNIGNQRVNQSQLGVYASLDTVLDNSDLLLGTSNTGPLNAGQSKNFTVDLTIPGTLNPVPYKLLAKVDNAIAITENSETNNVAIGGTINGTWKFGTVPGRTGSTTLTLRDSDGTTVTFSLTGPGTGEVIKDGANWDLKITGTTASSAVTITTNAAGNGRVTLNDIHVFGPLSTFLAATTDLTGTLAIDGPVNIPGAAPGTVTLGSVSGGTVAMPSVEALTILGAATNANFYIGTTFGQDGQPGGTEANADVYGEGNIGLLTIGGTITGSTIRVGVNPTDGIFGNGNDTIVGGTNSSIGGIIIGGTLSTDSQIIAGALPANALVNGQLLANLANDPRFSTDMTAPALTAALQQDSGTSTTDGLTNNPAITGSVTDANPIVTFKAGFGATATVDILADRQANGSFTLSRARLEQIHGASLTDGTYTLKLLAMDSKGNSTQVTVPFTLDTAIPTLTLDLAPASDTAPLGDQQTTHATVTLNGQTEANAVVELVGLGLTTTADVSGNFSFANVALTLGANAFTVRATDLAGTQRTEAKTITRLATNQAPVLTAIGNRTVNEGTALTFTAQATDPDAGQTHTFSLENGTSGLVPGGATINPTTGAFTWTPTEAQGPGSYMFDVVVTDNGTPALSDRETITVTVNEVNQSPTLATIPNQTVTVGQVLTFTAVGADTDQPNNTLTYSLEGNFSAGAMIDPITGVFTWTPTAEQVGGPHGFLVRVTDNGAPNLFAEQNIQVTVAPRPNQEPVLNEIGSQTVDEGQQLRFFANATDPDGPTTFTFSLEDGVGGHVPAGATIDTGLGTFSWTPTEAQGPGTYTFDVVVTDNGTPALSDRETITVTVNEVPQSPSLVLIPEQTVEVGQLLTFTAVGHDPDVPASGLIYSLQGTVPAGAAIDSTTGVFTWTPNAAQVGSQSVTVRVTDSASSSLGLFAQQVVSITVGGVADADLDGVPDADEGTGPNGGDANSDGIADSQQANVASFRNPVDNQYVTLVGPNGTLLRNVQMTGTLPADAPADVVFPMGLMGFELHGMMPGGTADVTMLLPAGADVNSVYKFGPEPGNTTAHWYEFNLTGGTGVEITGNQALFHFIDGGRGDADLTANGVIVDPVGLGFKNTAPVLAQIGAKVVEEGTELRFTAQATDANVGQTLRFSVENAPLGASIDPVTGLFTWTPGQDRGPSTYRFDVVVTDNGTPARSARETMAVTVVESDAVFFQGLGLLPSRFTQYSQAADVSADGSVVVGSGGSANGQEAFRWTANSGLVGLGQLGGSGFNSFAEGVSEDGSIVVGGSNTVNGYVAFRWTASGGLVGLGDLPGGDFSSVASDVSDNGLAVVGWGSSVNGTEAFRWTASSGMAGLGDLPGGTFMSLAEGVSADGSVVVGYSDSANGSEAFRWTASSGMVGLGDLPGGNFSSVASDVSDNGLAVVGWGSSVNGTEAFRWTASSGMVGLGDLPGGAFRSLAQAASTDGTLVVGTGKSANGDEAFVWDAVSGMRNLRDVLVTEFGLGADLAGWTLREATGISDDGRTITGWGINPQGFTEAWRVRLPMNQAPVNTVPGAQVVNEDTVLAISGLSVTDANGNFLSTQLAVAHGTLTVDLTGGATISAGANGTNTLTVNGTQVQINAALATLKYQGIANYNGPDTLTVTSADSRGATATDTVAITVMPVNDAPVGVNDTIPMTEDTLAIQNVLTNDRDVEGDLLAIARATIDTNGDGTQEALTLGVDRSVFTSGGFYLGSVTVTANGNVIFDPRFDYAGPVPVVTYVPNDGTVDGTPATVTLGPIAPVNDAPVVTAGGTQLYGVNQEATTIDPGLIVSDVDSLTLQRATVRITGNYQSGEDELAWINDGTTMGNIVAVGAFDAVTGTLTLVSPGATATVAEWEAALRAVTYRNTSTDPSPDPRTVTWIVNDGSLASNGATSTITITGILPGESISWIGPDGGSWHDPANWSLGRVPRGGDDVVIDLPPGTTPITYSAGATRVHNLTSNRSLELVGGTLTVVGELSVFNDTEFAEIVFNGGTLSQATVVSGIIRVPVSGSGVLDHVTMINFGGTGGIVEQDAVLTVTNGLSLNGSTLRVFGDLHFSGTQTVEEGVVEFGSASFVGVSTTGDTLTIEGTSFVGNGMLGSATTQIVNRGFISNSITNTTLQVYNLLTNEGLGMLGGGQGNITVVGNLVNSGIVSIGNGSILTVTGDFTNRTVGQVRVNVSGITGQVGTLAIAGTASLDGRLSISGGYPFHTSTIGDRYRFMTFANRVGYFSTVTVDSFGPTMTATVDQSDPTDLEFVIVAA